VTAGAFFLVADGAKLLQLRSMSSMPYDFVIRVSMTSACESQQIASG
jgi:hypothetical protein